MLFHFDEHDECLWVTTCKVCGYEMTGRFFLTEPLKIGNQCSRCLEMLDTSVLAGAIKAFWKDKV